MTEEPYKLPPGWRWVRLGEVCQVYGGSTPRRNQDRFFGGDIVWITPSDLTDDLPLAEVAASRTTLTQEGLASSSARLLPSGTVLFSSRATIGKVAIAGVSLATNQGFANFVCESYVDNRYLAYLLKAFTPEIERLAGSTT
ncbi:MAG: restriction endonuclease subunit S, partial [Candidatus Bipolaricaulota bacterium]